VRNVLLLNRLLFHGIWVSGRQILLSFGSVFLDWWKVLVLVWACWKAAYTITDRRD